MSADGLMQLLGKIDGRPCYWAEPGRFEQPGFWFWDGKKNVHVPLPSKAAGAMQGDLQDMSEKRGKSADYTRGYRAGYQAGYQAGIRQTSAKSGKRREVGRPRLAASTVDDIRRMAAEGMSTRAIAEAAKVSCTSVRKIVVRSQDVPLRSNGHQPADARGVAENPVLTPNNGL